MLGIPRYNACMLVSTFRSRIQLVDGRWVAILVGRVGPLTAQGPWLFCTSVFFVGFLEPPAHQEIQGDSDMNRAAPTGPEVRRIVGRGAVGARCGQPFMIQTEHSRRFVFQGAPTSARRFPHRGPLEIPRSRSLFSDSVMLSVPG